MAKPAYSFSIPSVHDDTPLDCRIYFPKALDGVIDGESHPQRVKGAIIAHPYAPLGGCFDDHVVLSVVETLVREGFVVGAFNFRGAEGSQGRSTWTGKGEQDDYATFVGFMINYLQTIQPMDDTNALEPIPSVSYQPDDNAHFPTSDSSSRVSPIQLLLGGYSYGSLVLARLPSVKSIIASFGSAGAGTAAAEGTLRAQTLAKQTRQSFQDVRVSSSPRGRQSRSSDATNSAAKRLSASPMILGGNESDPSTRPQSRDTKRSIDLVRKSVDIPHRIKAAVKRDSVGKTPNESSRATSQHSNDVPMMSVQYLLISPVLLPFSHTLSPPGPPASIFGSNKRTAEDSPSNSLLQHPTLAVFGTSDVFTSGRRLKAWAEKQSTESRSKFEWTQIDRAGHFWRGKGVMNALRHRIGTWVKPS